MNESSSIVMIAETALERIDEALSPKRMTPRGDLPLVYMLGWADGAQTIKDIIRMAKEQGRELDF